jgi:2-polyprenyl-3-methyl-5-hydroxy-6-metoxy-1,4-benzoquinol methylase
MKMTAGADKTVIEQGIVAGNYYDKYGTSNPVARFLMKRFFGAVEELVASTQAREIHEVGCGEGHLSRLLARKGLSVRGTDFSGQIIVKAGALAQEEGIEVAYRAASIYELTPQVDSAPLVVCCEVLEHLEHPDEALEILAHLAKPYLLVSVPREPVWRMLNLLRGKYVLHFGNTPGHVQHWSRPAFLRLLRGYFDIIEVRCPLPWTIALCRTRPE